MAKSIQEEALEIAQLLEDGKAEKVTVLDVSELNSWTDYFVIATIHSGMQVQGLQKQIKDYVKELSGNMVLNHISLTFESGKIYGLSGKNGSGKTMLMRAICGLIRPTEGYVSIDGQVIGKDISFPPSVGVLIESPSFISYYSGFKNLQLLASIKNIADDTVFGNYHNISPPFSIQFLQQFFQFVIITSRKDFFNIKS